MAATDTHTRCSVYAVACSIVLYCFVVQIGGQVHPHDEKCHLAPNPAFFNPTTEWYLTGRPIDHYPALQQVSLWQCGIVLLTPPPL